MNYLSVLAEKWFQPCYELRGCWTPHWIFLIFFLLSLSLSSLSLSLPLHMNSEESTLHTGKLLIHGGTTGELFVVDWSRGVDSPVSEFRVKRKPVLLLVVTPLDLCIKTRVFCVLIQPPPPSFPKNVCVSTYSNKAFLCIKSFLGKILRFWIRHLSSWKEKSQNSVEIFVLMDVLIADCDF